MIMSFFLKLEYWLIKHTNKKSNLFRIFAINKTRLLADEVFPDNTHGENIDISISAVYFLIFNKKVDETHANYEHVLQLIENFECNEEIKVFISDYFLAQSYAFSLATFSKALNFTKAQEIEIEYFEKAVHFNLDAEKFNVQSFKNKQKELKKDNKAVVEELKTILDRKVKRDKEKVIEPIEINASNVTLFTSLFSTLFIISGYYYTNNVLQSFGVNSDNFYSISDYLSTSVSLVLTPFLWTVTTTIIYTLGANRGLGRLIQNRQLSIKEKDEPPYSIVLMIVLLNVMNIHALITEQKDIESVTSMVMYLNFLVIGYYCIERLPWHYFKNPFKVMLGLVAVLGFTLNINKLVYEQINLYQSSDYEPSYIVEFSDKNISKRTIEFISINSNYVFMRDKSTKKIEIYPKKLVVKLTPNKANSIKDKSLQDYLVKWIELFALIYKAIFS